MLVVMFALLVKAPSIKQYFVELSPLPPEEMETITSQFSLISHAVFVGNAVVYSIQGILGGLSISFFDLGPAIFWGAMIAFTAFIPVVGAFIIVLPASVILLLANQPIAFAIFLAFNLTHMLFLEYYVKPRLIGSKTKIHAALVFLAVIGGVQAFGLLGIFYGPLGITMFMTLAEIYRRHYRNLLMRKSHQIT
jgi:predicted PurR-regulated permease PerM